MLTPQNNITIYKISQRPHGAVTIHFSQLNFTFIFFLYTTRVFH